MRKSLAVVILLLVFVLFYSCGPSKEELEYKLSLQISDSIQTAQLSQLEYNSESTHESVKHYSNNSQYLIRVYKVNGCEYISFTKDPKNDYFVILHAGDCCNQIHQPVVMTQTVQESY